MKDSCTNCRMNCTTHFTEEQRRETFSCFWELGSLPDRRQFIVNNINVKEKKRNRKRDNVEGARKERNSTQIYTLQTINICKTMFLNTLAVSEKFMRNAIEKGGNDTSIVEKERRGSTKTRKFYEDVANSVKDHIKSFPVVESHYLRKQSKRSFLASNLNVSKMYDLYLEKYKDALTLLSLVTHFTSRSLTKILILDFISPKKIIAINAFHTKIQLIQKRGKRQQHMQITLIIKPLLER